MSTAGRLSAVLLVTADVPHWPHRSRSGWR